MILVTGIGHSGTSYLMQIFEEAGIRIRPKHWEKDTDGLEIMKDTRLIQSIEKGHTEWPDAVKSVGQFSFNLEQNVKKYQWDVTHLFICIRDMEQSMQKRVKKKMITRKALGISPEEYAMLDDNLKYKRQVQQLYAIVGAATWQAAELAIPSTVICNPCAAQDWGYFKDQVAEPVQAYGVCESDLRMAWKTIVDTDKIIDWKHEHQR
jgi:hypothetical protein